MCGRFQLSVKGKQISERYQLSVYDDTFKPSYNCAPSQLLPVILLQNNRQLHYFKWGLIPFWAKNAAIGNRLINTRAETVEEKPSFRDAFQHRRCLIPANGFFEWEKTGTGKPYRFFMKDESIFSLAGIWESWKNNQGEVIRTFSILTTRPNALVQKVHPRMPVILAPNHEQDWLNETKPEKLKKLLLPFDASKMDAYPVSKRLNNPAINDPGLVAPETGLLNLFD